MDKPMVMEWAMIRKREIVYLPDEFTIHEDYQKQLDKEDLIAAYRDIRQLFQNLYQGVAKRPEAYGMSMQAASEVPEFSTLAREIRRAPYRPVELLYHLLACGDLHDQLLLVRRNDLASTCKIKKMPLLFQRLEEHGFVLPECTRESRQKQS